MGFYSFGQRLQLDFPFFLYFLQHLDFLLSLQQIKLGVNKTGAISEDICVCIILIYSK